MKKTILFTMLILSILACKKENIKPEPNEQNPIIKPSFIDDIRIKGTWRTQDRKYLITILDSSFRTVDYNWYLDNTYKYKITSKDSTGGKMDINWEISLDSIITIHSDKIIYKYSIIGNVEYLDIMNISYKRII